MNSQNEKKKRSANFSEREIDLLCKLVVKYAETVESKKTDALTWKDKNTAWEKLTAEFNFKNKGAGTIRTLHNLQIKYEGIKKELRKKIAKNKQEMFKTGGGVANITPLASYEESIYNLITLSVEGLPARFDDDNIFDGPTGSNNNDNEETIYIELDDNSEANEYEFEVPKKKSKMDFKDFSESTYVRTPSPPASPSLLTFQRLQEKQIYNQNEDENVQSRSSRDVNKEDNNENSLSAAISPALNHLKWNPKLLKKPASKELNVEKKNLLTKLQAAEKVSILSESKKELIQLQITYVEKELDYQKLNLLKIEQELKNTQLDGQIKELEKRIKEETLKKMTNTNIFSI